MSPSIRLSRPTYVGDARVRRSACGRWTVTTRRLAGTRARYFRHDLYDRRSGQLACEGMTSLAEVRAEIDRRETAERLAAFRGQDRYFVPEADADAWAELERRGLVTLHEDADGDTYAERVPAERSGGAR